MKPAIRSALAEADILATLDRYAVEVPHVLDRFVLALERAISRIEHHTGIGAPRYAHELNIPLLRFWVVTKFPYAVFYIEHDQHLAVIRVVHMSRDIPATLQGGEPQ